MAQTKTPKAAGLIELTFDMERETKGTWRFQQQPDPATDDGPRKAIGTLYITKKALVKLGGNAKQLRVTVETVA